MTFLSSVNILCSAVKSQEHRNMDYYCNKSMLAERVEMLIIEEPVDMLISSLRQQAMFCIMEMSHVNPKFQPLQRMELIQSGIFSLFSLPPNMETDTNREIVSLYSQTVRALDEMLQGLMTENEDPSMLVFIEIVEIIMPWILSDKIFEKVRALSTLSRQLRFICNFPTLRHLEDFKIGGNLMGILGLFCMDYNYEVSSWASAALHYCFKFFVNQRQSVLKTEEERQRLLKNLQKDFQANWATSLQYILMFFKKFLNPNERTTIITLCVKAMTVGSRYNTWAPVQMLEQLINEPLPDLSKVPELIEMIYNNLNNIKDSSAIKIIEKSIQELAQKYPDEVMLMFLSIQDNAQDRELWKILAASSKGYDNILNHLLKRLKSLNVQDPKESEQSVVISSVVASRALNELLLESSSMVEVETFYPWLYMALLSLISFLVFEGGSKNLPKQPGMPEWLNPVSCTIEALKTLISSAGYGYQVSFMQYHKTWELLADPEGYLDGIALVAKSMIIRSCWHIRPIVSLIFNILNGIEVGSSVTALAIFTELLRNTEVAVMTDETIIELLINFLQKNEPVTQQLVLKAAGNFGMHKETNKFFRMLQPYILSCCYSTNSKVVTEAFLALRCIIYNLTWTDSVILLIEISCALRPFFDDESDDLRYNSIDMFAALLAKVKRRFLMAPFRYQVHCSLVPLMFHLQDENINVAHASRDGLCHSAKILVCPRLKSVCSNRDMFTIGRTLVSTCLFFQLEEQKDKILWFLSQSLSYFNNPQSGIRQAAVWLTSQIIQIKDLEGEEEYQTVSSALKHMKNDPDPAVSCLATQTICILGVKRIQQRRCWHVVNFICCRHIGKKSSHTLG
ncbi:maestro heat-like repeat-containing protein family member 7 isoform X1 [Sarcophilus harrisii]|uniref:maestro heat-like repeat-containing protein family member 7 isoform X1 n=1 Tax=Sarcophilus harrisii TaxID=9305 RepID=UPI001301A6CC|nr:maestro heat-like repeat-containing protein family member 7 isoform X1 [Sarcophilus harrisii]